MSSPLRALSLVVEEYDATGRPVTPRDVAHRFECGAEAVRARFAQLEDQALITDRGDGYRPTVTGRELHELDLDDEGLVILDPRPSVID